MSIASAAALITAAQDVPAPRRLAAMDAVQRAYTAFVKRDDETAAREVQAAMSILG